jgi:putative photosynthetic complex assembly protein
MQKRQTDPPFPRPVLWGAAGMVFLSLVAAAAGRMTNIGTLQAPDAPAAMSRDLAFLDRQAGGIEVRDASTGEMIDVILPGEGGFVRGVMRSFARERRLAGLEAGQPFRLVRRMDGRIAVVDAGTGRRIELDAFGPANVEAFVRYLVPKNNREGKS